jgi:hypothetical protein
MYLYVLESAVVLDSWFYCYCNTFLVHKVSKLCNIMQYVFCSGLFCIITIFHPNSYSLCDCRGRDRMVVGFTTFYTISAYHH